MKRKDIQKDLERIIKEFSSIADEKAKLVMADMLNLVETLARENKTLETTVQKLKDGINKLKGEQGKPTVRKQIKNGNANNNDHSSEKNRTEPKAPKKKKRKKKGNIQIDRRIVCNVDKNNLPDDIIFKGYEPTLIQDIVILTNNIEFQREIYYSPSLKKTFIAPLPEGYVGEVGPGIRTLVLTSYHDSKMTGPAIERFFSTHNIHIAKSTISRMLTDKHEPWHQEKEDIVAAGFLATPYQHMDDTTARVNGKNHYTHVLCNHLYTAYFTMPKKDRITVLEVLCREKLKFTVNSESCQLMRELGLPEKHLSALKKLILDAVITRSQIDEILEQLFPASKKKKQKKNRKIILEASAIVFYKSTLYALEHIVCDNAPQFNNIAKHKVLCWIHEGRHYKKLNPIVSVHRTILDTYIDEFWGFYRELLNYKENPTTEIVRQLDEKFDEIFTKKTGYEELDDRIARTYANKVELLMVLDFPFLPLQNNPAELGARCQARHRDINLQTRNKKGTAGKDTFLTIVQTAHKLKVNVFKYIKDRMSKKHEMPSLASLIRQKSQTITDTS